jgi:hypothetical protein
MALSQSHPSDLPLGAPPLPRSHHSSMTSSACLSDRLPLPGRRGFTTTSLKHRCCKGVGAMHPADRPRQVPKGLVLGQETEVQQPSEQELLDCREIGRGASVNADL